jgi:DnaJ-class molecular chaperone
MATKYLVVDAFDGGSGDTLVSTHRSRETAERKADRMNRGLSGEKYRIQVRGDDCPDCDGAGYVYRDGLNRRCSGCAGTGSKDFYAD